MPTAVAIVGTDAVAEAMRQINPDVVPAYPITPQTAIVETYAQMIADGKVDTRMIYVESEHSAMSAAIGASAAGARVMTATSSQGLALMWEMLYIASSLRLPIVMANVNRALSAPVNIHCDHSDSMGARDSSWIQLYSESAQEAYDNMLQAVFIAEHREVRLPVMVLLDGFIVSHAMERVELLEDEPVKRFIGAYEPENYLLNAKNPVTFGAFDSLHGYYFEFKRAQQEGMYRALEVIKEAGRAFAEFSGRSYGLFEEYMLEDAEIAVIALGSAAGTIRETIKGLRNKGLKIGLIKLRVFRPFPIKELAQALSRVKVVGVFDRADTFAGGLGGPVFVETCAALYRSAVRPLVANYIYGLGGRDLTPALVEKAVQELAGAAASGLVARPVQYLGLREEEEK